MTAEELFIFVQMSKATDTNVVQKMCADKFSISQSYVSRIYKQILTNIKILMHRNRFLREMYGITKELLGCEEEDYKVVAALTKVKIGDKDMRPRLTKTLLIESYGLRPTQLCKKFGVDWPTLQIKAGKWGLPCWFVYNRILTEEEATQLIRPLGYETLDPLIRLGLTQLFIEEKRYIPEDSLWETLWRNRQRISMKGICVNYPFENGDYAKSLLKKKSKYI